MNDYRDDGAAVRERAESLRRELDETKRMLEESRVVATVHAASCETLQRQLTRAKPSGHRALLVGLPAFLIGLLVGASYVNATGASGRSSALSEAKRALEHADEAKRQCESSQDACEQAARRCRPPFP